MEGRRRYCGREKSCEKRGPRVNVPAVLVVCSQQAKGDAGIQVAGVKRKPPARSSTNTSGSTARAGGRGSGGGGGVRGGRGRGRGRSRSRGGGCGR